MIILFDENEKEFSSLGLGILKDVASCQVKEGLNDAFELEMEYPIDGNNFSKIEINKIIYCKPNPYDSMQPFRIGSISKPINGVVTINAYHISYDMNGIGLNPIYGLNLRDTLEKIQNGTITHSDFKFYTDTNSSKTYKTTAPYNMRAVLMGSSDSILEKYECEVKFDKFDVHLLAKRGSNRGVQVRYAKNLTDLKHDILNDNLYNGVYPYYHKETTNVTSATTTGGFKQAYIVGKKPYQDGWLSYTTGGEPYHPVDTSPIQIATEGDYYQKVYTWNPTIQRYEERIYNQSVTLIEGVTSPDWIYIDWTKLPNIVCKAGRSGYFKTSTENNWTYHAEGEVIFEGKIKSITTDLAGNFIMYYAEVIPTASSSSSEEETSVSHVELKDKILWIDTPEAKAMKHNRILMLDLTSEFEDSETPDEDKLKTKTNEYIEKNKIGKYKFDTDVSFVDMNSVINGDIYKDLEKVELGDTVKVVYQQLNVDVDLRVISTEYDVLSGRYTKIELGEKADKLSGNSVQTGDDVSSLTNDVGYTDVSTVNKLIAKTVTADFIQAKNAKLTTAQITELQTARIKCTGILEATQLELDTLVAKMLVADNAAIANELKAGTVTVAGDITINSGAISITNGEKVFFVTRDGDLTANSVTITGGSLNIADSFEVTNDGILTARGADIQGIIQANEGNIGGFTIGESAIYHTIPSFTDTSSTGVYLGTDGIKLGSDFKVDNTGKITANSGEIGGASIVDGKLEVTSANIKDINVNNKFIVETNGSTTIQNGKTGDEEAYIKLDSTGKISISNADVKGTIKANSGEIGGFNIQKFCMFNGDIDNWTTIYTGTESGIFFGKEGIRIGKSYKITADGGTFVGDASSDVNVGISKDGKLTAKSAEIVGKITAKSGFIGDESNGFTITSTSIENGFKDIQTGNALANGIHVGTDCIRLGQDVTRTWSLTVGTISVDHQGFDAPIGNLPIGTEILAGGTFKFTFDSYTEDRVLEIGFADDNDAIPKDYIKLSVPSGTTSIQTVFPSDHYTDTYHRIAFSIPNGQYGFTNLRVDLVTFPGFIVDNKGLLTAYNVSLRGSFQGDVNIDSGSIKIQNGGTTTFEVTSAGELTATIGHISGFDIDSNGFHKWTTDIGESNSVLISHGYSSSASIGGSSGTNIWALTAGNNFGVTTDGNLYAKSGKIAGIDITNSTLGLASTDKINPLSETDFQLYAYPIGLKPSSIYINQVQLHPYKWVESSANNGTYTLRAVFTPEYLDTGDGNFEGSGDIYGSLPGFGHRIPYPQILSLGCTMTKDFTKTAIRDITFYIWEYTSSINSHKSVELKATDIGFNEILGAIVTPKCDTSNQALSTWQSVLKVQISGIGDANKIQVFNSSSQTATFGFYCLIYGRQSIYYIGNYYKSALQN